MESIKKINKRRELQSRFLLAELLAELEMKDKFLANGVSLRDLLQFEVETHIKKANQAFELGNWHMRRAQVLMAELNG